MINNISSRFRSLQRDILTAKNQGSLKVVGKRAKILKDSIYMDSSSTHTDRDKADKLYKKTLSRIKKKASTL